ncbi:MULTISPECIES: hypothetical protein [unclassified Herbaspirillum]|jgi:hypothetical protein|uniref:hypothetical protein n=1 Tax=unclassified Herbaspirillum TaxID=2624150 RepID=UPI000E2EE025|nr:MULTISPECIES: hypothetical protein [unclassified Herbaspirillum]RFB70690.1 hypothetical protein DZB54_08590 [Herbaspirillum sp. 3R-3a1]TFI08790.1 hypothetical protein E4P32_11675 [Herbaspirillum sp. 3R11]TFI15205.1 hypothetical protein E4P31_11670 [Herbaspirillum sp. 3R-11]TFI22032.1 hypothetical protein E4P30_19685 [Herbaspirillum sp. 3C11]
MDWLDAATAALAIIAVPLALRYPLRAKDDSAACDCTATTEITPAHPQVFPQEEEPTQERQPDSSPKSLR